MKKFTIVSFCLVLALSQFNKVNAQKGVPHDTTYYKAYPNSLMPRIYFTQKYARFNFPSVSNAPNLKYAANGKLGFGIGATYNNFTLNVAYGFSFLNTNTKERGKTKGFDFQLHLFPGKWAADAILTAYKGAYTLPKGYGAANSSSYYYRDDADISLFGLSLYRVPNTNKFSYRAAMVQNEWQKKSAGSVLYGGDIYYGQLKGDSGLIPSKVEDNYPQAGLNDIHFISVGPGIGYAYTLVAAQHFFIMGSLVGNLDATFTTEKNNSSSVNKTSVDPVAIYKAAAGYNGNVWSVCVIAGGNSTFFKGDASNKAYYLSTGQYKLFIAKKIMLKHKE